MCFLFHKWRFVREKWTHVVGLTYEWKELYQFYRCDKCRKVKEKPSGIRRSID